MKRNAKMCGGCPFHLRISRTERIELAALKPEEFPCHEAGAYGSSTDIQCRGHWEVARKFGETKRAGEK